MRSERARMVMVLSTLDIVALNRGGNKMFGVCIEKLKFIPANKISPKFQPGGEPSAQMAQTIMSLAFRNGYNFFPWRFLRSNGEAIDTMVRVEIAERHKYIELVKVTVVMIELSAAGCVGGGGVDLILPLQPFFLCVCVDIYQRKTR